MELNFATTVSFCAAATAVSYGALGAYLGRSPESRRFRWAAVAGLAAATYCFTNAILAGRTSAALAVWAARFGFTLAIVHGAAWLAFIAEWQGRQFTRFERTLVASSALAGILALVPGVALVDSVSDRSLSWGGITYRDPGVGPLAVPIWGFAYVEHIVATASAFRLARRHRRARVVAWAFALFCAVMLLDCASGVFAFDIPYLVDPAVALIFVSVGSVVTRDAAESMTKSVELERARAALAERENLVALGQLAAVVAHEVRNPVAIIYGALANLKRKERDDDDARLLGILDEEAQRLKYLVERLLDSVRPFELQYAMCNPAEVIGSAVAAVISGESVPASEVEVVVGVDLHSVECDAVLVERAISNLVQNALAARGRRSPVRVSATVEPTASPAMLCVDVTDDGEGVAVDVQPKLFTPFFTTRATGTGLGLAIVQRIVKAHGGSAEYDAGPNGRGARFVIRLPLRAESPRYPG